MSQGTRLVNYARKNDRGLLTPAQRRRYWKKERRYWTAADRDHESWLDEYGRYGDDIIKDAASLADWDIIAEGGTGG